MIRGKKIIKNIFLIILACSLLACSYFVVVPRSYESGLNCCAELIVNDQTIGQNSAIIYQHGSSYYAELPLTAVIEGAGYSVLWDDNTAHVQIGNMTYTLCGDVLSDNSGKIISQGKGVYATLLEMEGPSGELYMETSTIKRVLSQMGISLIQVNIDPMNRKVLILLKS